MCKVTLDSLETAKPTDFEIYPSSTGNMEKNWMPIHKIRHQATSTVDFLHSPSLLFTIPDEFKLIEAPKVSKSFRGGTQVFPTKSGGIGLIHELYYIREPVMNPVTFAPIQSHRCYTHRFVSYDKDFNIDKVSPKFVFISQGIEFASGITEHGDNYVISFGRADRATYIATIDKQKVFDMLEDTNG
jgi:hypothetical protein